MSPAGWATARDVAGTFGGVLVAAGLLAAVRVARRPTPFNGIVLGLALALVVRAMPPGWGIALAGAVALALGRASWVTGSVTALAMLLGAGPAIWARSAGPLPDVGLFASRWQPVFGSMAWLPPENALPGSVALSNLIVPAAGLMIVLALSGVVHAIVSAWTVEPRLLLLPAWAVLGALSLAMLPPAAGEATAAVAMLPLLAGLAVVPLATARWAAVRATTGLAVVLLIGVGAVTVESNLIGVEQASSERTSLNSLRGWQALADTIQEAADRTGAIDLVALADDSSTSPMLESLLHRSPRVRRLPPGASVLPLDRETLFLALPGTPRPVELTRPSSQVAVFTPFGADTSVRLLTLRPRPAIDWLARAEPVSWARFADGSAIVGVVADRGEPGHLSLTLFWELPAAADGRAIGQSARLMLRGSGPPSQQDVELPSVAARRGGELVGQQTLSPFAVSAGSDTTVTAILLDASGAPIPTRDGAPEATILAPRSAGP